MQPMKMEMCKRDSCDLRAWQIYCEYWFVTIWLSAIVNERDKADEITLVSIRAKENVSVTWTQGYT